MKRQDIVCGTCDGTGAVINVCLGFIPRFVLIWNNEDANRLSRILWTPQMALIAAVDEGIKEHGLSDTDFDRTAMTSAGIAAYAGGDELFYDGPNAYWENAAGTEKTEVYVDGHYERSATTDAAFRDIGDTLCGTTTPKHGTKIVTPPGFTINEITDLNVNGEQIEWIAFK